MTSHPAALPPRAALGKGESLSPPEGLQISGPSPETNHLRTDGWNYKININSFPKALFEMESGIVRLRGLSKNREIESQGTRCCRDSGERPQEASWTSNQIITVISISRWDSTNSNTHSVISILRHCHFPRANGGKGITIPGNSLLPLHIAPPFN